MLSQRYANIKTEGNSMIKKDIRIDAKGRTRTHIRVVEGYRPGRALPPKQRTIKDFGFLEDQVDQAAFMLEVEHFDKTYRQQNVPLRIEAAGTARMYEGSNRRYNYGWIQL
jgi:hypothetical protein